MRLLLVFMLLVAPIAHAGGVALGPPPEPPISSSTPADPLPPETVECILAALDAGLDPVAECGL